MVGAKDNTKDGDEVVVEFNARIIDSDSKADSSDTNDEDFAKNHDKVGDLIDKESSHDIGGDEVEGVLRWLPESWSHHGSHDEGVPVDVLDDLLQEEEASSETPEHSSTALVAGCRPVDLVIDVLHNQSEQLHHG